MYGTCYILATKADLSLMLSSLSNLKELQIKNHYPPPIASVGVLLVLACTFLSASAFAQQRTESSETSYVPPMVLATERAEITDSAIFMPVDIMPSASMSGQQVRIETSSFHALRYVGEGNRSRPAVKRMREKFQLLSGLRAGYVEGGAEIVIPLPSGDAPFLTIGLTLEITGGEDEYFLESPTLYLLREPTSGRYRLVSSLEYATAQLAYYPEVIREMCASRPKTCGMLTAEEDIREEVFQ